MFCRITPSIVDASRSIDSNRLTIARSRLRSRLHSSRSLSKNRMEFCAWCSSFCCANVNLLIGYWFLVVLSLGCSLCSKRPLSAPY